MKYTASVACANPLAIGADVAALLRGGISTLHVDFMDGHNVPNLCLSPDTLRALRARFPAATLDVHLMVENPADYFGACAAAGAELLSIVPATHPQPEQALAEIRALGMVPGIALNPKVSVEQVRHLLPLCGLVTVMSIQPGQYGAAFLEGAYGRIRALATLRAEEGLDYAISVDGGVTRENGLRCRDAGADMLVLGVFTVFRQQKPIEQATREYLQFMEEH